MNRHDTISRILEFGAPVVIKRERLAVELREATELYIRNAGDTGLRDALTRAYNDYAEAWSDVENVVLTYMDSLEKADLEAGK